MASGMFIFDGIGPVLDYMVLTTADRVSDAMREGASLAESYAKSNAPWADRTGQAREGLYADVYVDMGEVVLELGHTAEHGYWLELIQDGRFAVIMPTLETVGPEVIAMAGGQVVNVSGAF